ncbi:TIGR04255 family protein [Tunturiibacter lichenicola]|uniref:TIGR04255 family protein n=1 Tax=Tunturiibacter lichenicola TaxID=2051959 RepID=UPI0021B1D9E2|nr:TIGR04255 family protein [Edaphobacter lichenicola]
MAEKMSNPPIFFAASQVTFNEIRGMEKFVDAIQEKMRAKKYVDFSRGEQKTFQINAASPDPSLQQSQTTRWQFVNFEKTSGYVLLPNSLFFQTTDYETSDELRHSLLQGLEIVHEIVGLDYVQAIGLRTLDAIIPRENETVATYLKSNLLGFSQTFKGTLRHTMTETVIQKEGGVLVARVVILGPESSGLGVPFDLYPIQLKMMDRFQTVKGMHAVLDNDRTQQDRFKFDLHEIEKRFTALKEDLTDAFYAGITQTAEDTWRRTSI